MSKNEQNTMYRVLTNIEFFTYEEEVWIREADGTTRQIHESDYGFISIFVEYISTFYPKAYTALLAEYQCCAANTPYYRYRMAVRFIRCNFSELDSIPDITADLHCNFEHVNCPLRGECRYDHVICRPEFDHRLSAAELRVMALVYEGLTEEEIGVRLRLSPHTIHTHVRNAYSRLGLHSKAEFMKYAAQNNLFS